MNVIRVICEKNLIPKVKKMKATKKESEIKDHHRSSGLSMRSPKIKASKQNVQFV